MTRQFVKSVFWWQCAMVTASGRPNTVALLPFDNLEGAAFERDAASAWTEYIETHLVSIQASVEASSAADGDLELEKWRGVLEDLRMARTFALEHAKSFGAGDSSPR